MIFKWFIYLTRFSALVKRTLGFISTSTERNVDPEQQWLCVKTTITNI